MTKWACKDLVHRAGKGMQDLKLQTAPAHGMLPVLHVSPIKRNAASDTPRACVTQHKQRGAAREGTKCTAVGCVCCLGDAEEVVVQNPLNFPPLESLFPRLPAQQCKGS